MRVKCSPTKLVRHPNPSARWTDSLKSILIIAGPNGAGKTILASEFLPNEGDCPTFIKADLIASGLNPFQPERSALEAGRLMLRMMGSNGREVQGPSVEERLKYWASVDAAMRRTAIKARRRTIATTGSVPTWRNGELVYDTEM